MKKFLIFLLSYVCILAMMHAQIGNVGINTTSPAAMLHVKDSSVVFTGIYPLPGAPGIPPISGSGTRMMWYPDKGAFRVGGVSGTRWDKINIGIYSVAMGYNSKASGELSTALGSTTNATGTYSTAMGSETIASGTYSTAMGHQSTASGLGSTALGDQTIASGSWSTAMGSETIASGTYSTAMGHQSTASGFSSTAFGDQTIASGSWSTAIGFETLASGDYSTAMGEQTSASGNVSTTMGHQTSASGFATTAMGSLTSAVGSASTALGLETKAYGSKSVAMGDGASASGNTAVALGLNTIARSYACMAIGRYNDTTNMSSKSNTIDTDPVFVIGNGTDNNNRTNAFTVLKNGNTGIGIISPAYPLHVATIDGGAGGFDNGILIENLSTTTGEAAVSFRNHGSAGSGNKLWITGMDQNRNFSWAYGPTFTASVTYMILDSVGNLTIAGVYSPSDMRLKKQITPLENELDKILQVNGYHYYWDSPDKDQSMQTGLIAQEVETVMPELVRTNDEGIKSVNYTGLIPYLIESIKEQQSIINQQQQFITDQAAINLSQQKQIDLLVGQVNDSKLKINN